MIRDVTFSEKVIQFLSNLDTSFELPENIELMNPFKDNPVIQEAVKSFYTKFYKDTKPRTLIIGINPGRLGAGATGIPFTDTKRLNEVCNIPFEICKTHEPSSVFVYALIDKLGGPELFYHHYFISSVSPLGFIHRNTKGKWVNCNYYDYPELVSAVTPFIYKCLKEQASFCDVKKCFILGKKNAEYFRRFNDKLQLFHEFEVLEHPRYIMQYKSKQIDDYLEAFSEKLKWNP